MANPFTFFPLSLRNVILVILHPIFSRCYATHEHGCVLLISSSASTLNFSPSFLSGEKKNIRTIKQQLRHEQFTQQQQTKHESFSPRFMCRMCVYVRATQTKIVPKNVFFSLTECFFQKPFPLLNVKCAATVF